eukprot:600928-Pelagomonas_calceolata.AAC.1
MSIAWVSNVQPAEQGLNVNKEKERRKCISLNGSPFHRDFSGVISRGESDSCSRLVVQVFDDINGIRGESK